MKSSRWIKYTLILFVIVAIYQGNRGSIKDYATKFSRSVKSATTSSNKSTYSHENSTTATPTKPPLKVEPSNKDSIVSNFTANVLNKVLDNPQGRVVFEEVINRMAENYHNTLGEDLAHKEFLIKELKIGKGAIAECGDKVSISYSTQNPENPKENLLVTKDIYLGSESLNKFLENGIVGMRVDGNRKVVYLDEKTAASNKKNKKKDFITGDVTLNKVTKSHRQNANWGIFVDKESFSIIGKKMMCGDNIKAYYKIRDISDGRVFYDSKENNKIISFNIGSHKTPYKITKGLIGLVANKSKISIASKVQNLNYKDNHGTRLLPEYLPHDKLVIVDIDTKM